MIRRTLLLSFALALAACDADPELPENPAYAVPGQQVTQPPAGQPIGAMPALGAPPTEFDPPLAVPGQPQPLPIAQPQMPPGQMPPGQMPPGQMPPGQMPPGQVPPGQLPPGQNAMQPTAAPITLAAGFIPDPQVAQGIAVGQIPASNLNPACRGYVPATPNHVLSLSTPFNNLRVLVNSTQDTVLVMRGPDGAIVCSDDLRPPNPNPGLEGPRAAGPYTIWVGTYAQGGQAPYRIGFTELGSVTAESLGT